VSRGGWRPRRYVTRHEAPVWCPGGRWGPRRVRTNECWGRITAEQLYDSLLASKGPALAPGVRGKAMYIVGGHEGVLEWETRQNAVWRHGRVFLKCPRCWRRCTRVYLPLEDSEAACRRCWGLTYSSRALSNYKNSLWGGRMFAWMFGTTQRDMAYQATDDRRAERRAASKQRWAGRRTRLIRNGITDP